MVDRERVSPSLSRTSGTGVFVVRLKESEKPAQLYAAGVTFFFVLVNVGATTILCRIQDKVATDGQDDHFLLSSFLSGLLFSLIIFL